MIEGLVEHFEHYLGKIKLGFSSKLEPDLAFQIVLYNEGPIDNVNIIATLGLSDYKLKSRASEKYIQHELIFLVRNNYNYEKVPNILYQLGIEAIESNEAYLRGDVIDSRGPIFKGSGLESLYITLPVYYPDEFFIFSSHNISVVIVWIFPITRIEAKFINDNGWNDFENLLTEHDPDLLDYNRSSIPV